MTSPYREQPSPPPLTLVDEAKALASATYSSSTDNRAATILCGLLIAKAIGELAESVDRLDPTGRR